MNNEALIELRRQRVAELRSLMLLLELGAGLRAELVEEPVVDTQQAKDGAA